MVTINVMAMTSVVWMVMSVSVVIPVYRQGKFKSKLCKGVFGSSYRTLEHQDGL
jgi:hypothetical protein